MEAQLKAKLAGESVPEIT